MCNDNAKVKHLIGKIAESLEIILQRCENIHTVNDFLDTPGGTSLLGWNLHETYSCRRKYQEFR